MLQSISSSCTKCARGTRSDTKNVSNSITYLITHLRDKHKTFIKSTTRSAQCGSSSLRGGQTVSICHILISASG